MKNQQLLSTVNTQAVERKIRRAVNAMSYRGDLVFEHGHWWLTLRDGSIFDVVDSNNGFELERVS